MRSAPVATDELNRAPGGAQFARPAEGWQHEAVDERLSDHAARPARNPDELRGASLDRERERPRGIAADYEVRRWIASALSK